MGIPSGLCNQGVRQTWLLESGKWWTPASLPTKTQSFIDFHRDSGLCKGLFKAHLVHLNTCCLISSQFVIEIKDLSFIFKLRWKWISKICFFIFFAMKAGISTVSKIILGKGKYICEALSFNGSRNTTKPILGIMEHKSNPILCHVISFCLSF